MGCGVVIPAAGSSQRMGDTDKTSVRLLDRSVIEWVLEAFQQSAGIDEIVLVAGERNERAIRRVLDNDDLRVPVSTCRGGSTRQESVARGVAQLSDIVDLVLIHDMARPLVTPELIEAGIAAARECGAAIAAVPVVDTIKHVDRIGVIVSTPNRADLWAAQTPQVFRRDWLERAYQVNRSGAALATDEASLLERAGFPVQVYPGDSENLKLTTPLDLVIAEAILSRRQGAFG